MPDGSIGDSLHDMHSAFGPLWRKVFLCMIQELYEENYIGKAEARKLGEAMGIKFEDGDFEFLQFDVELNDASRETDLGLELCSGTMAVKNVLDGPIDQFNIHSSRTVQQGDVLFKKVMRQNGSRSSLMVSFRRHAFGKLLASNDSFFTKGNAGSAQQFDKTGRELFLLGAFTRAKLASERLTFFFKQLHNHRKQRKLADTYLARFDSLTEPGFDPRILPTLSMVIPVFAETIIPSVDFLKMGSALDDARNQPDNRLGERTKPPVGDGVNSNLAFCISQFRDEWNFFAAKHNKTPGEMYDEFMRDTLDAATVMDVRMFAAMRTQSVAKTVIGALGYQKALRQLPKVTAQNCPAEVIVAHQTFGAGDKQADEDVSLLVSMYQSYNLSIVFDFNPKTAGDAKRSVEEYFAKHSVSARLKYARVQCKWDADEQKLVVVNVIPRLFPLRVGSNRDMLTQGKASNQMNGMFFASGHVLQAMDCNMGIFVGECFKVPFLIGKFFPAVHLEKYRKKRPYLKTEKEALEASRSCARCRYIGFREFIFTGREGSVGECHAAAEFTFGTIYQRFLSFLGARMHYGHPDFLDAFWARNRGGMSKCSPTVNLSEDLFAGYNVRLREEPSPHVDFIEYEKGREATFNAASNFFNKISGGSVAVLRSRDNAILCERVGIVHGLNFYFSSVAFYFSTLCADMGLYVGIIVVNVFTLGSGSLSDPKELFSAFTNSMFGPTIFVTVVMILPMLIEVMLEKGFVRGIMEIFGNLPSTLLFFVFQNKNIASAVKHGVLVGKAAYLYTGRPMANQHQTWRDLYVMYAKSHYFPAFNLVILCTMYYMLDKDSDDSQVLSYTCLLSPLCWLSSPLWFSPYPRLDKFTQDMSDFVIFILGKSSMSLVDMDNLIDRHAKNEFRNVYEMGLAELLCKWGQRSCFSALSSLVMRVAAFVFMYYILPATVLDHVFCLIVSTPVQWLLLTTYLLCDYNNVILLFSCLLLFFAPWAVSFVSPVGIDLVDNTTEYFLAFIVYSLLLGMMQVCTLALYLLGTNFCELCLCRNSSEADVEQPEKRRHFEEMARISYIYFFDFHFRFVGAICVLVWKTVLGLFMIALDLPNIFGAVGLHSYLVLNSETATCRKAYMDRERPDSHARVMQELRTEVQSLRMRILQTTRDME
eukprot:TRINITY_DN36151_c0_g2_i1.p1 TRINITY_DN36151_c0_g2~~TRINITY_DN36151_c0_g2_i1.p1  ORF type:complete len:1313 (+),score=150.57 TRINITY_DN36151_c0_g2_i1:470-3940(+)